MPSLILSGNTVSVRLESKHLEVIRRPEEKGDPYDRIRVPLFDIDRALVIGRPVISIPVLQKLMWNNIPVYFLTSKGRWIGALSSWRSPDASRRVLQYKSAGDGEFSLCMAKALICAKLRNSRRVLQRLAANRSESSEPEQEDAVSRLKTMMRHADGASCLEELRGYEGMGAAVYFKRLGRFFPEDTPFKGRNRRPPRDEANALLSFTYTVLLGEMESIVRARGLDPCIGFFHQISHGTPSLPLDLMECLRAPVCDLLVLNILNHKIIKKDDFECHADDGGIYMRQDARKDFFTAYENTMARRFRVRVGAEHTDFRREMDKMVLAMLKTMEGKDEFAPFNMP